MKVEEVSTFKDLLSDYLKDKVVVNDGFVITPSFKGWVINNEKQEISTKDLNEFIERKIFEYSNYVGIETAEHAITHFKMGIYEGGEERHLKFLLKVMATCR
jgi:hypothetical protein